MRGDFLAGTLSAADFALYPLVGVHEALRDEAAGPRCRRNADAGTAAWKARMEALPYFDKTIPPHWKTVRVQCNLTTTAFADMAPSRASSRSPSSIPSRTCKLSANRNPDFAWSDVPPGTRSLALLCHDPDVPSRGDDVNQEGRVVPASLPRVDFFHWVLVDLPPSARGSRAACTPTAWWRAASPARRRRDGARTASTTTPAGSPATRTWRATISATTARARRGTTRSRIATSSRSTRSTCRARRPATSPARSARAMEGHVLAQAAVTGRYTLNPAVRL